MVLEAIISSLEERRGRTRTITPTRPLMTPEQDTWRARENTLDTLGLVLRSTMTQQMVSNPPSLSRHTNPGRSKAAQTEALGRPSRPWAQRGRCGAGRLGEEAKGNPRLRPATGATPAGTPAPRPRATAPRNPLTPHAWSTPTARPGLPLIAGQALARRAGRTRTSGRPAERRHRGTGDGGMGGRSGAGNRAGRPGAGGWRDAAGRTEQARSSGGRWPSGGR